MTIIMLLQGISIHALLAESDFARCRYWALSDNFYPRSPCGERHVSYKSYSDGLYFYPRSPCGERLCVCWMVPSRLLFLSTLSLRRATTDNNFGRGNTIFLSTLSLRRATWGVRKAVGSLMDFYPRSPCGERPTTIITICTVLRFLSTLSLRRATAKVHKTVGHFCAYETNFMEIASSC